MQLGGGGGARETTNVSPTFFWKSIPFKLYSHYINWYTGAQGKRCEIKNYWNLHLHCRTV